jgi:mediator of RNA polymerase II transcription subunit 17
MPSAPPALRRKAIGQLSTQDDPASSKAHFPFLQNVRLRVTLELQGDQSEPARVVHNTCSNDPTSAATSLETSTQAAQREVVEIEIFGVLVREAGTLPTASVRVSEQLIVIEAAQGTQLRFELVSPLAQPIMLLGLLSLSLCFFH